MCYLILDKIIKNITMKKFNKIFLIVYLFFFVITGLCYVFWWDKDNFDLEYREKGTTTAVIYNFETDQIVQELYNGRRTEAHNITYFEYSYLVDGVKYQYGSQYYGNNYSIGDKIEIEYVKRNPAKSKVKGLNKYSSNYFIRNSLNVGLLAFIIMLLFIGFLSFFEGSEIANKLFNKIERLTAKKKKTDEINNKTNLENVNYDEVAEFLIDTYINPKSENTPKE